MIKIISRVGDSHGLAFDSDLLELTHLKVGDQVSVEVHEDGRITLTPVRSKPTSHDVTRVIKATMKKYARTMKRLA